jgi:ribosomal protein L40E
VKTCGYCGRKNSEDASNCRECGTPLEQEQLRDIRSAKRALPTKSMVASAVAILTAACLLYCLRPKGLIGLWRTGTFRTSPTGHEDKIAESYQTAEFLKNGSFKLTAVMKLPGGKDLIFPQQGTYTMIDSNHVRLNFTPISNRPDAIIPLTVSFTISGNQLQMDTISSGVIAEKTKYRRVWW